MALTLINLCAGEVNDAAFARTTKAAWLGWLNDAQRSVVLVRPDANSSTENLTLVAGVKQALPAGGLRLLSVTRNMGADGATPGKALRMVEREAQDAVNLDWYSAANASPVREIIYDDKKNPLVFWTRPGAIANWKIEATLSKAPTDVTDADAGLITLSDVYAGAMQMWMLFRAYSRATQATSHLQRSQNYYSWFFSMLGVKLRGEAFDAPATPGALPNTMPNANG